MKPTRNPFVVVTSLAATTCMIFLSTSAMATDYIWSVATGDWSVGTNWSPTGPPTGGAGNFAIINSGTASLTSNANTVQDILINRAGVTNGSGTVSHSAGTISTTGWTRMGLGTGGTAGYTLSGTGSLTTNRLIVAETANAGFTMTGGTLQVNGELWTGGNAAATGQSGSFSYTGGTGTCTSWLAVGRNSTGSFTIGSGTFNAATTGGNITSGSFTGAIGTINVNGGLLATANAIWIGEGGTGTLNLTGGEIRSTSATAGMMVPNAAGTGTVNLNGGTISIRTVGKGTGTGTFNFNGGTLQGRGADLTLMAGLTRANVRNGGAIIDTNGFNNTISQALLHTNIGGDAATDGGLTKTGSGTLILSGANTFNGDTVISAGFITTGSATALGGSTLNYNNQGGSLSFGTLTATTFGGLKGAQNLALTNTTAGNVALTAGANNTSNTYSGVLSGGGSLTKNGTGTLTLTNSNTFTGNMTVYSGPLIVTNSGALGSGTKTIELGTSNGTNGNPQLHLDGSGGDVNLPATFTYSTSNVAGTIFNDAGTNSIAGQINMTAGGGGTTIQSDSGSLSVSANITATTTGRALNLQGAANGTISGAISNGSTAALPVTKSGAGTWVLSGTNTYTGATTINGGALQAGATGSAFGSDSPVVLANASGATLALNGFDNTIGSLSGGGTSGGNVSLGTGTLTVGSLGTSSTYAGVISGTGGLIKIGSEKLTLTNASSHTGATTISDGILALDHSGANLGALGDSAVSIAGAATLSILGNTVIGGTTAATLGSAGTISLQDGSINTLALAGAATFADSTLEFDLGTGSSDQITTGATATVSGTNTINLKLLSGQSVVTGSYTLMTAPGGLGSGGAGFDIGSKPAGFYNYTLTSSTPTAVVLTISGPATPSIAYWTGLGSAGEGDPDNNWASGSTVSTSNWSTTVNGLSDPLQVPGANTDVFFTAANAASDSGALETTLDAAYSIKSLTFDTSPQTSSPISSVTLNAYTNSLILGSGGLTVGATDNSSTTLMGYSGSGLVLNGSQSWANHSNSQPLAVNLDISGLSGSTVLTLNGSGTGGVTLGGNIGNGSAGSVGLVLAQAGATDLNGNNTFTGGVVVSNGTVVLGNAGAFNSATPNTLAFSAGSTGLLQLNGNSVSVSSLTTDATVGTPVIENGGGPAAVLTDNLAAGTTTYAGLLRDGGGGGSLGFTKAGAGSLALTAQNTYTGPSGVNGGTLTLGSAENAGVSGPLGNGGAIGFGGGILQYGGSNQFDYSPRFSTAGTQAYRIDTNGQNVTLATNLTSTGGSIQKYGTGTLTLTGTASAVGNVWTHAGTLLLDTAAKVTTTGYSSLGLANGDSSSVTLTGTSQLLVTGDFNVSDLAGSNGVLNIADSTTVKGTALYIGKSGTATGTVNQTGGAVSATTGAADWRIGGAANTGDAAAVGIYNISAGSLTAPANFQIGAYGNGSLNISGTGTVTDATGWTAIGRFTTGYGVLDVSGGSFTYAVTANRMIVGEDGAAVLNVRGGTVTSNSSSTTMGLTLGNTATANSTVNLLSGSLVANSVGSANAGANSRFNFNGGTLKAGAASATYMQGLTAAYVYGGGAKIDADGKAITIGQPLLSPAASSGVASVSVTNGGSGYKTPPIVKITGGGGTGATAVATINGLGEITGIIVTNPGTDYTSEPTINLVNGLSGGAGATFSTTVAANTSGDLTVSSTTAGGVLTLTGVSTFTGSTTINAGATLQLGNGTTGNDGTIPSTTILDNGTLAFNRFGSETFSVPIPGIGGFTKAGPGTLTLAGANTYTGVTTIGGGVLSVADIGNGGAASSNIGSASAASANIVFNGNGTLLYTGPALVTDRGYTVGTGGGIDHASDVTITGQVLSTATGSFTKNGAGTLNLTYTGGTNTLTGGNTGNGLGFVVNNGVVNLAGTPGSPLAQTNVINSELIVGTINTGSSPNVTMNINGGTTTIASWIGVGRVNGTNNAATTLNLNNNAVVSSGNFSIGYSAGSAGYTSSPTVNFNGTSSFTDTGVFTVGESVNGVGGISAVTVNGSAALNLTNTAATAFNIGAAGEGVLTQTGGGITAAGKLNIARDATSTGTYHLNGGTLTAPSVGGGLGTSTFNFNGGTLAASAGTATFLQGLGRANVRDDGAIINTGTFNVTAAQALVHSNIGGDAAVDGGLTKQGSGTLTMTSANSYTGDTTVSAGTLELQALNSLDDAANVKLSSGSTLNLNFAGTDTVSRLYIDGVEQSSGTWGAAGSGATHESALFAGTGILQVDNGSASSPFVTWAGTHGLTGGDALPGADPDADGYTNLAEFVLGGEPNPANPGSNPNSLAPAVNKVGGNHVFSFRRSQLSLTEPGIAIAYEYSSDLSAWTAAVHGVNGITINVTTDGYGSGIDKVDVSIPDSLAPVGVRFARLRATVP